MLVTDLATYVLSLEEAAAKTVRQEDQPLYQRFRAHAGYLLALAVADTDTDKLNEELEAHDRLWVQTLLVDDVCQVPINAWQIVRQNAD